MRNRTSTPPYVIIAEAIVVLLFIMIGFVLILTRSIGSDASAEKRAEMRLEVVEDAQKLDPESRKIPLTQDLLKFDYGELYEKKDDVFRYVVWFFILMLVALCVFLIYSVVKKLRSDISMTRESIVSTVVFAILALVAIAACVIYLINMHSGSRPNDMTFEVKPIDIVSQYTKEEVRTSQSDYSSSTYTVTLYFLKIREGTKTTDMQVPMNIYYMATPPGIQYLAYAEGPDWSTYFRLYSYYEYELVEDIGKNTENT